MKTKILMGVVLIIIGLSIILDQFNLGFWSVIGKYWPVILILMGIERLNKPYKSKIFSFLLIFVGFAILISNLDILDIHWSSMIWALILIAFGISMIIPKHLRNKKKLIENINFKIKPDNENYAETINDDGYLNYTHIFSGYESKILSKNFRGGEIYTIFGGADIDLRDVQVEGTVVKLELYAIFGGIDVMIPSNWKIQITGMPIFGAVSNNTKPSPNDEEKTILLLVEGYAIFGGIEIKN